MADLTFEPQSMLDFASYLRDTPGAAEEDPAVLAAMFGLPQDIVEESLQAIGKRSESPSPSPRARSTFVRPG